MFSPSPFPSGAGRRTRNGTPSNRRSHIPGGSKAPSRLSTPAATGARVVSDSRMSVDDVSMVSDGASEMSVDAGTSVQRSSRHRPGVVFAQSEELRVSLLAHLPSEVLQVLKSASFAQEEFLGDVDTLNGFCLITSTETCFVWKYVQSLPSTPTCYIFPCPRDYPNVPFSALVSFGPSREPGLILLSQNGEMRFWDSIGLGLTGGDRTDSLQLDLDSNEAVTAFVYAEPQNFVASTSNGRMFLFTVTSTGGKFHVTSHFFTLTRPQNTLSLLKFWGAAPPAYSSGNVTAITTSNHTDNSYEVWTCMDSSIVKWTVMKEGWEQFDFEEDIQDALESAFMESLPNFTPGPTLDLELLDLAFDSQNDLILLASFAGKEDQHGLDTRPRRFYAVVRMAKGEENFEVKNVRIVPYQTISADRANIHPRLRLLSKGLLYCVEFGDAVAVVAKDSQFSNILTLKSQKDRTFGAAVVDESSEMLLMNSEVVMKVEIDLDKVNDYDPNTGRGTLIKSIMTQAILFGSNSKNPLLFTFPPDVDEESLISGAEQLSRAVLSSDLEVVQPNPDLSRQINERKDRLKFLIGFINENGVLGKMSQASRQRLATDAEKLYASQQLWNLYCSRVNAGSRERPLVEAVYAYMQKSGEGHHEDIMRAFFRLQTRDIGAVLSYVKYVIEEFLGNAEIMQDNPDVLCRGIDYLLCILQSAWNYRDTNVGVYGLTKPMLEAWTSTPAVVEIVLGFFKMIDTLLDKLGSNSDSSIAKEARNHLPPLAASVFRTFQERLDYLDSPAAADKRGVENDKRAFREQFQQVRSQVLQTLLKNSMERHAFKLAEDYRDFHSLVDLCHSSPPIYPITNNAHANKIEDYIEKYKEEFTDELYHWYIEHGELRCMFAQSDINSNYVDAFFAKHPNPSISWVHDLGKGRWSNSAATLLSQANGTTDLATRHVMLSIGKLAQMAGSVAPLEDSTLDPFHDGLDYISVHGQLIRELREPLVGTKARQSLENQVEIVAKALASHLRSYPAFLTEFKLSVKAVLQNHVLDVEDLIDVLTLRDSADEHPTALELIKSAKGIPQGRRLSTFRTIWRRTYIHDDWATIRKTANITDSQLVQKFRNTALYQTVKDSLTREEGGVEKTLLPLEEAAIIPTQEELQSRWPGHSVDQIQGIMHDYEVERKRLVELDLQPIIERVKELAVQELEEDIMM